MESVVKNRSIWLFRTALAVYAGGIFAFDLSIELGVASGILYVFGLPIAYLSGSRGLVLGFGAAGIVFTSIGWIFSPFGAETWIVATNRLMSLVAVGMATWFAWIELGRASVSTGSSMADGAFGNQSSDSSRFFGLLWRFVLGGVLIGLLCLTVAWSIYQSQKREQQIAEIEALNELASVSLQRDLWVLVSDVEIAAATVERIIEGTTLDSQDIDAMAQVFLDLSDSRIYYDQVRYLNTSGKEIFRINFTEGNPTIIPDELLQDKSEREYFKQSLGLEDGQVYLSGLDLNVENGEIERPLKPVIRAVAKIISPIDQSFLGFFVINYDARFLLNEVIEAMEEYGDALQLVSTDGTWEFVDGGAIPWGVASESKHTPFNVLNPSVWSRVLEEGYSRYADGGGLYILSRLGLEPDIGDADFADDTSKRHNIVYAPSRHSLVTIGYSVEPTFFAFLQAHWQDISGSMALGFVVILVVSTVAARITMNGLNARTAIEESQSFLSAILDHQVDALIVIDSQGIIRSVSASVETMFDYKRHELIGENVSMLMKGSDRDNHDHYLLAYVKGGQANIIGEAPREVLGVTRDGTELELELAVGEVISKAGVYFVGSFRDISVRKRAERAMQEIEANYKKLYEKERQNAQELTKATEDLMQSNEELEQFAYVASHDLKSPLRGIHNLANWIEESVGEDADEELSEYIKLIKVRITRLESLLDDILSYSRAGRMKDSREDVPLTPLLEEYGDLLDLKEGLEIRIQQDLPVLYAPPGAVKQVFGNLLSNAVKHHDREEGLIEVTCEDKGGAWVFHVSDDGPGIPAEFHARIFGMFQTLQSRDEVEGSGMGLALAQKIVRIYGGGHMRVVPTEADRGTTFEFSWKKSVDREGETNETRGSDTITG